MHPITEISYHSNFLYQVTRLREYQGVDPHFDTIARQYHDIVKVTKFTHLNCSLVTVAVLISCCFFAEIGEYAMDNTPSGNGPQTST